MSSVWNLMNPLRMGRVALANRSGRELYGTVIKQGKMNKTVSVRVSYHFYHKKLHHYFTSHSKFLVHDHDNFTRPGDKVVIQACEKLSKRKYYFIRNVVKQFARGSFYDQFTKERRELIEQEYRKALGNYKAELSKKTFASGRHEFEFREAIKQKAKTKALQNVQRILSQKAREKAAAATQNTVEGNKAKEGIKG